MVTKRKRAPWSAVAIRTMWSIVLPGTSWALIFALDNITGLGIPMWACIPVGAVLYGVKKRYFNTTKW